MIAGFRKLNALDELGLAARSRELSARIIALGVAEEDADAVAQNTALLHVALRREAPRGDAFELLECFSLEELAELCENYRDWCAGLLEGAVNISYEEEL